MSKNVISSATTNVLLRHKNQAFRYAPPLHNTPAVSNLAACQKSFLHVTPCTLGRFKYFNMDKKCTNPDQQQENFFETKGLSFEFGPGYLDKLSDLYQEKFFTRRDLFFKREDSLIKHDSNYWLPKVDPLTPKVEYRNVQALKDAPESVRKIFSIGFGERRDIANEWRRQLTEKVQKHPLDAETSLEARIGLKTANIRQWTQLLESMTKKPGFLRNMIHSTIEKRRKLLRLLREQDYESFQNVLKQLKIAYHVRPLPEDLPLFTRKGWMEHVIKLKCEMVKGEKLRRYHATLKKDREDFSKKRDETLKKLQTELETLQNELNSLKVEQEKMNESEQMGVAAVAAAGDEEILKVQGRYLNDTIGEYSEHLMLAYFYFKPQDLKQPEQAIEAKN